LHIWRRKDGRKSKFIEIRSKFYNEILSVDIMGNSVSCCNDFQSQPLPDTKQKIPAIMRRTNPHSAYWQSRGYKITIEGQPYDLVPPLLLVKEDEGLDKLLDLNDFYRSSQIFASSISIASVSKPTA